MVNITWVSGDPAILGAIGDGCCTDVCLTGCIGYIEIVSTGQGGVENIRQTVHDKQWLVYAIYAIN